MTLDLKLAIKKEPLNQCTSPIFVVVLAGGSGSRLWPVSRKETPKQFLRLHGNESMLESTLNRLPSYITPQNILIVTNADHVSGEAYKILNQYQKLLEPVGRNTAPAIALTAAWLQWKNPGRDPIMVVLPADHSIQNIPAFHQALEKALHKASEGNLVTFGIQPSRPDTGFGYIKTKAVLQNSSALMAEAFTEKPDTKKAEFYCNEGSYFWNSGMFVWKASAILKEIETHLPEVNDVLKQIRIAMEQSIAPQEAINQYFPKMPDISIDYGVLEKIPGTSARLAVIPCDISWSDVGSWDAVYDILPKDEHHNAKVGNVQTIDCKNTLVYGEERLITAVGIDDLCIIETGDALLVTKRHQTQRVSEVVSRLKEQNVVEHNNHMTVKRPWGSYTVLEEQTGYKMKHIIVDPGASLSLQRHQHRSEHWVVVEGAVVVTCDQVLQTLKKNESTYIPKGAIHRLENKTEHPALLIEVQVGDYLGEDDIERFDDVYGRTA